MNEYRRFIQQELDSRGWRRADLARAAGLSRQLISTILNDTRDYIGQMPDESTLAGLAKGFGVPVERVRVAAARSLTGYIDDGEPLGPELSEVPLDALLNEIRRRFGEMSPPQNVGPSATDAVAEPPADGSVDLSGIAFEVRERAGLTQAQVADRMGTSQSAIAAVEGGSRTPSVEFLERLARACGGRVALRIDIG